MAFRIHDSVVRGEIDNREKGIVRGKIWVMGREEPVTLELKGNAWPDLAGCLLKFNNPSELTKHSGLDSLNPMSHPLQHRCFESAQKYWHLADELDLDQGEHEDLGQFIFEFQTTGVKLAGALNGIAEGHAYEDNSFTVAYLKRALDPLHKSQAGLEAVAPQKLLPNEAITEARRELFEIREGILKLMDELRGRG
ncbi:MAG TPA: hypothetical protein VN873_11890 [Candidatus Angelobacter sp.]|nr:hypothetical protein [Candidatus Angelobacter sp.]